MVYGRMCTIPYMPQAHIMHIFYFQAFESIHLDCRFAVVHTPASLCVCSYGVYYIYNCSHKMCLYDFSKTLKLVDDSTVENGLHQ